MSPRATIGACAQLEQDFAETVTTSCGVSDSPNTSRSVAFVVWGGHMLLKLTSDIAECYRRAAECRERAESAPSASAKQAFLDLERRWLSLAHSYEFAERLSDLPKEVERRRRE